MAALHQTAVAPVRTDVRRSAGVSVVLRTILDHGPIARSTIARRTGLSAAAVSRHCAELTDRRLVRELPSRTPLSNVGRPHVPVDLDLDRHAVGGIHIAVPHTTVALVDLRGRVIAEQVLPHTDRDPARVLDRACGGLATLLATDGAGRIPLGIGLATGGWVNRETGDIVVHDQLGWSDVPAGRILTERWGLPTAVENHSRALARAELLFGAAREQARESLVHLFVGNMVDAALSTAGGLQQGPRSAAGEIAHLPVGDPDVRCDCGGRGCFQATVSDRAMAERAAAAGVTARVSFDDLVAAARDGVPGAVALFRQRARGVGRLVAMLLDLVNPEVLVVAEGGLILLPELRSRLLADLHEEVRDRSRTCRDPEATVLPSSFGSAVLGVAAGSTMLDEMYAHPLHTPTIRNT